MSKRSSSNKLFFQSIGLASDANDSTEELKNKVQDLCEFVLTEYELDFDKLGKETSDAHTFYYDFDWQEKSFQIIASIQIPNRYLTASIWNPDNTKFYSVLCAGQLSNFYALRDHATKQMEKFLLIDFQKIGDWREETSINIDENAEYSETEIHSFLKTAATSKDIVAINKIFNIHRRRSGQKTLRIEDDIEKIDNFITGKAEAFHANADRKQRWRVYILTAILAGICCYAISKTNTAITECLKSKSEAQCFSECTANHSTDYCKKTFERRGVQ